MSFFKDIGKVGKALGDNFVGNVNAKNAQQQANISTQLANNEIAVIASQQEAEEEAQNAELIKNATYFGLFLLFVVLFVVLYKKFS